MMTRPIATLENCRSPVSGTQLATFDELASWFAEPALGTKDGPAWMPAEIDDGPRTSERVKSVSFLALDVEADAENIKSEDGKPLLDDCGDAIKRVRGPEPPAVDDMLAELALHGWRCCLHTSYSHGGAILPEEVEHPRYRLIFDLSRPLTPGELKPLGLHVAGLLGLSDCFDAPCLEPARLFYAPRCPTEERKRLYRHAVIDGEQLPVDDLLADAARIEASQKSALDKRHPPKSANVIDAFNQARVIGEILEAHGYSPKGRRRWLWAGSTTGLPGVRQLPDAAPERIYSSHGGDPLNDGHAHDAFDCWRILRHGGDMSVAVKEAARLLGLNGAVATRTSTDRAKPQPDGENAPAGECGRDVGLIRASDITPEPIAWLWIGWLAAGKMHVFGGAPGTGKTTISMALAATATTGGNWPDGTSCVAGNVVIWSGEDDPADTLIPRLVLSGADLSRVFFISDIRDGNERRSFDPARDMEPLRRKLVEIGGAKLLIVDPIVSAIAGDSHKNAEVRRGLQPLVDLAASMRCALLGITHFSKGTSGANPVERLTGSLAFGALARVVLVAATHESGGEEGRNVRIFCRAKSNIGPDSGGFAYDLHQAELKLHPGIIASAVQWGEALEGEARELLSTAEASGGDDHGGALADAKQYLSDLLSDGPLPTKTIKADASDAGHSWATIRRALKALGCEKSKDGMDGGWAWRLPGHEAAIAILERANLLKNHEDVQQKEVSSFGEVEHLRSDSDGVEG